MQQGRHLQGSPVGQRRSGSVAVDPHPLLATMPARGAGSGAGFVASIANLANAAVGAGVLALPYAFKLTGLALAPAIAAVFALLLGYSLHVLAVASDFAKSKSAKGTMPGSAKSYQEIVKVILGDTAEKIIMALQLFYLTGSCIVYLIIMNDQVRPGWSNHSQ